jgi:protein-S-isoprenylcysteine O-methyltransferase Ste14
VVHWHPRVVVARETLAGEHDIGDLHIAAPASRHWHPTLRRVFQMDEAPPIPHPGVGFPPPFIYAGGLLLGWWVHRQWPLPLTAGASQLREIVAVVCIGVWLVLMLWASLTFLQARTTFLPNRPARLLVTTGPYTFTRNPMYLSLAALYIGVTLWINSWWPVALLPIVLILIRRAVVAREERYLASAFPSEYSEYCRRVRRWM